MVTPLYKALKDNGTSFYAFPGSAEDISAAYQNENTKMYFSKFALLNFPKQVLNAGADNDPIVFDFENTFETLSPQPPAGGFKDELVQSLRNYVANHEITIRQSRLNDSEFFYDNTLLPTTAEPIFWKWAQKLNAVDFEVAVAEDEWFDNLEEFESNNLTSNDYFQEYLWKEREETEYRAVNFYQTGETGLPASTAIPPVTSGQELEVEFSGAVNFKEGDTILFQGIVNGSLTGLNDEQIDVLRVIPAGVTQGSRAILDTPFLTGVETEGTANLVYNRFVEYIGEITAINNVQEANKAFTEVYAHISDGVGATPDVLFRTKTDDNYKPNLEFPIIPTQYQPEIIGAENFNSPIIQDPELFPGDQFGQFDTDNFTYETSSGDLLRRSGEYFGVFGDVNNITFDPTNLDGVHMNFDTEHYVKMNILNKEVGNFDEFNGLPINNEPPKNFEYNAILWYYTIEDQDGNLNENVYGVSFLDNPDNNVDSTETGLKIPTHKKFVNDGTQDGTSYAYSLNLNFNIIDDNSLPEFNPNNVNGLFSFNLFNESMKRLAAANDAFLEVIANNNDLQLQIEQIRSLVYTQIDIDTIKTQISNLESLLTLFSSLQLVSSNTIQVIPNTSQSPPTIELQNIDPTYFDINNINTTDLYSTEGFNVFTVTVPTNKNFLVKVTNNDETELTLDDNLTIVLDKDLYFKQTVDIIVDSTPSSTQNKKLEVYIASTNGDDSLAPINTLILGPLDLPVYWNENEQTTNQASFWENIKLPLDLSLSSSIIFKADEVMEVFFPYVNGFKKGDTLLLNNFMLGATVSQDFSGQYVVDEVSATGPSLTFKMDSNEELVEFADDLFALYTVPYSLPNTEVVNQPFVSLNKGYKYQITRDVEGDDSAFDDRYLIERFLN